VLLGFNTNNASATLLRYSLPMAACVMFQSQGSRQRSGFSLMPQHRSIDLIIFAIEVSAAANPSFLWILSLD
jgi:hypothetical protein